MNIEFSGTIIYWRGPAPFYFVTLPEDESHDLKAISSFVTYGWGMIPVSAQVGQTEWKTALFPKDGRYLVPIKTGVREAEDLDIGDEVTLRLAVGR